MKMGDTYNYGGQNHNFKTRIEFIGPDIVR